MFGDFGPKAPNISFLLFYGTAYQRFLAATLATYSVARPSSSLTLPRVRPSTLLRLMNRRAGDSQGVRDQRSDQGVSVSNFWQTKWQTAKFNLTLSYTRFIFSLCLQG